MTTLDAPSNSQYPSVTISATEPSVKFYYTPDIYKVQNFSFTPFFEVPDRVTVGSAWVEICQKEPTEPLREIVKRDKAA